MSIFDTEQNIKCIPLSTFIKKLPEEVWYVFIKGSIVLTEFHEPNLTELGFKEVFDSFHERVYPPLPPVIDGWYHPDAPLKVREEIRKVFEMIMDSLDSIPIDTSIPLLPQITDYINKSHHDFFQKIYVKPFINFNYSDIPELKSIYSNYLLRYKCGQLGFGVNPNDIVYIHIVFENGTPYGILKHHLFYPFEDLHFII